MRILCDEGVPRALGRVLRERGLDVSPQPSEWRGLSNGRLIAAATQAGIDVLLSNDKNMVFQLNLAALQIGLVTLPGNLLPALLPRVEDIAETLRLARPGRCIAIGADGRRLERRLGPDGNTVLETMAPLAPFDRRARGSI